jgi:hypothetical protein
LKLGADTRDALWQAQEGRCWICQGLMTRKAPNEPHAATLDHIWPKARFGVIGNIGVTLLACKRCNGKRGNPIPTDDDVRTLISVWRRVDPLWIRWNMTQMEADLRALEAKRVRLEILKSLEAA